MTKRNWPAIAESAQLVPPDQVGEQRRQLRAEVGPLERELDVGSEEVDLAADVVAPVLERASVHGLALEQPCDAVGELELAARAGLDLVERAEDLRCEHVPPD